MSIKAAELQVVIDGNTEPAEGTIKEALGRLGTTASTTLGVFAGNMMTQAFNSLQGLASEGLNATTRFEQLKFSLESMLAAELRNNDGTLSMADALGQAGGKAQETMRWIEDLALKSPFESSAVTSVFQMQMRLGASSDTAKQLTEALLNMGAATGLTTENLSGAGYALAQIQASPKLIMQDVRQLINAGVDVTGVLKKMGYSLKDVGEQDISSTEFMQAFFEQADQYGGSIDRMNGSWTATMGALADFKEIGLREFFGGIFKAVQPVVSSITEWLLGPGRDALQEWGSRLGNLATKLVDLGTAFSGAGLFSQQFSNALGDISPVLQGIWDSIAPVIQGGLAWINEHREEVIGALTAIAIAFGGLMVITTIGSIISAIANPITLIIGLIGLLGAAWAGNWGGIRDVVTKIWNNTIKPVLSQVIEWLQVNIPIALNWLSNTWNTIWTGIQAVIAAIFPIIENIFKAFRAAFQGDWYDFGKYLGEAWRGAWNLIGNIILSVGKQIWNNVKQVISNIWTSFQEINWGTLGENIITGICNGIQEAARWLVQAAIDAASAAFEAAKGFLGVGSPSKLFEQKIGVSMVEGWARGIESQIPRLTLATDYAAKTAAERAASSTTTNYNLYLTSGRSSEKIIQDFWLMRSTA